ncbi:MAG: bifunctional tRNA (5-methylaminomethyl-2-thiouridine)(34)-methyltransferase MnmD/FAD-dependent 5-carboxymethylaminomethyl-2-thiouridine(34) oxidoreductase MnmC [Gammaproteobacteria bacterium]|nr:bifunctional tRNA (5-methylaminomethyl-2-thiouridine)(34)-methyltransferase MnmD/FAD-dependent 5-carboxymethylaminomethyl-2-thiouridine(34) oxidoreductase MnmC [Gammaproteobacteria bacterium]MBU1556089.1 bifunctional tRNA (5-methylaminomethyl-2-thiouridine)(34)-methyltransferase MnmD/FAD-dependent 5-carboxymethylaminomethyl-2-thiouridine(34) oxidoreductase MnmC [Gammaproteobacteria bacterium]MBU2070330.1 bifunctional tRNA (5-methylaminomethyl-2-thiouridine)(34)-methyltransferase MnmD/FAD-depen
MSQLSHAKIHFNDQGTPVAADFDDVYFSNDGGLAETDYVFLQHNGLPQRWQTHERPAFHIFETGFGTGANFLLSWQRFRQFRQHYPESTCQRLYFSSVEKFPLTLADLSRALAVHTELQPLCQQLLAAYPLLIAGCHRLSFDDGTVILDLWLGDVNSLLPELSSSIDAVYLDGFAPGKNPQMWQDSLFSGLAKLSHNATTVATFTSAGIVKRGLHHAGFSVTKVKGYGRKREMLTARFNAAPVSAADSTANSAAIKTQHVTLVGGGIASICTALLLLQRGIKVSLLCEDDDIAAQASQNRQGAVYPNLHATLTADSQLQVQAFLYARQFYQYWQQQGLDFAMDWCGMLHLATTAQLSERQQKLIQRALWPEQLVCAADANTASALAGVELQHSGIYFPLAGWLSPQQFCRQARHYLQQHAGFELMLNCHVSAIQPNNTGWQLQTTQGVQQATQLVLACGSALANFAPSGFLPLNKIRGQVSHVQSDGMTALKTVLCHKGYITPQWQGLHCVGATFDRTAASAHLSAADDAENLALVNQQLDTPAWFSGASTLSAAAAFRATVPDHLPVVGEISAGLFVLGAMGARGITLAPLLSEVLVATLNAEPLPLSRTLLSRVSGQRFQPMLTTEGTVTE